MRRRKTSPIEDVILLTSKLPWWVGILLAIASYLVLHMIASRPAPTVVTPGLIGYAITKGMMTTLAMFGQYILPFAFVFAAVLSGITSMKQKRAYENLKSHPYVAAMNEMGWEDFERVIAEYYRRKGFAVIRNGGNGSDGGVDLVLRKGKEKHLVQCKHWKAYKVSVQPVREFYGVMSSQGADGGYFVTSGIYTQDAEAFARGLNLELVDGRKLRIMMTAAQRKTVVTDIQLGSELAEMPPLCPVCGGTMTKRVAHQGKHTGKEFWGCTNYPKCRGLSVISPMETRLAE